MNKKSKLQSAFFGVFLLFGSVGAANAANVTLTGTLATAPSLTLADTGLFNNTYGKGVLFTDNWFFNLGSPFATGAVVVSLNSTIPNFHITGLDMQLFNTNGTDATGDDTSLGTGLTIGLPALGPGIFRILVTGLADGSSGGSYSGHVNLAAPVPLPAAVWLLGSALVGLGVISRRRETEA